MDVCMAGTSRHLAFTELRVVRHFLSRACASERLTGILPYELGTQYFPQRPRLVPSVSLADFPNVALFQLSFTFPPSTSPRRQDVISSLAKGRDQPTAPAKRQRPAGRLCRPVKAVCGSKNLHSLFQLTNHFHKCSIISYAEAPSCKSKH